MVYLALLYINIQFTHFALKWWSKKLNWFFSIEFCLKDQTYLFWKTLTYMKMKKYKKNVLYVDTKCNCEKWSPIHTSSKDSEIYMAWATKKVQLGTFDPNSLRTFFLPVWHICPVKPGEQKQENMLTPSLHVLPCRQGWLAHSSMPAFKEIKKKWQKSKTNNCNGI